jgi:hypothetical protein
VSKQLDIILRAKDAASKVFDGAGNAASGLASRLRGAQAAAQNMAAGMSHVTSAARRAIGVMGKLGGVLKGLALGGIAALIGGIAIIPRALGAMRNALEKTADSGGGTGSALEDTAASAANAASDIDSAANTTLSAAQKAQVAFGAFGDVGSGFIQSQGRVTEGAASNAAAAQDAAESASEALAKTESGFGGATDAASRFGSAMDRISNAFGAAGQKILAAIAEAITPALEKLADFLESPVFQQFVDLLAKDLATVIGQIATWLMDKAIPAVAGFLEKVNEAGGPIEFFKQKWNELKTTVLQIVAIVLGVLLQAYNNIRSIAGNIKTILIIAFETVRDLGIAAFQKLSDFVLGILEGIRTGFETAFTWIRDFVQNIIKNIGAIVQIGLNAIIGGINTLINGYNALGDKFGLPSVPTVAPVSMAKGAIVNAPVMAIVGDNPRSPEVVAPLDQLTGIIREALGMGSSGGGNLVVHVTVPANTSNPQSFGQMVGMNIAQEMRRRGLQVPVVL